MSPGARSPSPATGEPGALPASDPTPGDGAAELAAALLAGHPAALARAITLVENTRPGAAALLRAIEPRLGRAAVIGFTGAPGAGKSTLVGACVGALRGRGQRVGVVAVDPSSPVSGGALLGDRIRMAAHAADPGVFVRSLASRGASGGLSPAAARVVDLMDAAGYETVILETVGAGQSEVDVARIADATVVVCAPGLGDEVQALKAGILEIADLLVLNKADLPLAARARGDLQAALGLRGPGRAVPLLETTATTGAGVEALVEALAACVAGRGEPRRRSGDRVRGLLAEAAGRALTARLLAGEHPALDGLARAVYEGAFGLEEAARRLSHPGPASEPVPASEPGSEPNPGPGPMRSEARGEATEAAADAGASARIRRLAGTDRFLAALGVEVEAAGSGHATIAMTVRDEHLNFNHTVHGGVIFSLADGAFGLASNSHGTVAAGIDAHIAYTAPARAGERLRAQAREAARSRRLATYRVEVRRGDGRLIATFTGTVLLLDERQG